MSEVLNKVCDLQELPPPPCQALREKGVSTLNSPVIYPVLIVTPENHILSLTGPVLQGYSRGLCSLFLLPKLQWFGETPFHPAKGTSSPVRASWTYWCFPDPLISVRPFVSVKFTVHVTVRLSFEDQGSLPTVCLLLSGQG